MVKILGYEILEMEKERLRASDRALKKAKKALRKIIGKSRDGIKGAESPEDALSGISSALREAGYERLHDGGDMMFNEALASRKFVCTDYVYVFLSIAEEFDLPLKAVHAPEHVFLRWDDGKRKINWEPLKGIKIEDEDYAHWKYIDDGSIENGVYLRGLEREEVEALQLNACGHRLMGEGRPDNALECFEKALEMFPQYPEAWTNKGVVLAKRGKYEESIACHSKAIELSPNYCWAWRNKGEALAKAGKDEEAEYCRSMANGLEELLAKRDFDMRCKI